MKGHENSNPKQESSPEIYSGSLIEHLLGSVSSKMGLSEEKETCKWETPESSWGRCDGGFVCGRQAVGDTERCEKHQEESDESEGAILREGLKRVGCPIVEVR